MTELSVEAVQTQPGDPVTLLVQGDLDLANAGLLIEHVPAGEEGLVIDLSLVPFMDSSGLRALVLGIQRLQRAGARVAVTAPSEQVAKIFRMTGVDKVLDLHPSMAAGQRALRAPGRSA